MSQSFRLGDWEVSITANSLKRQDEIVVIEPKMMNVLAYLAEHAGQVISTEQLLIEFWRGTFYGDAPVQKCIAMLRKKLGDNPKQPLYIETVQRRGYRVIAEVQFQDERQRWGNARPLERWTQGSPYLGLQSFQPHHAPIFFGCNKAIAETLQKISLGLTERFPFLLLMGKSGSGKSSLLRAGLIPFLTRVEGLAGVKVRDVRIITPKSGSEGEIFSQLFAALEEMKLLADNWLADVHAGQLIANPARWPSFLRSQNLLQGHSAQNNTLQNNTAQIDAEPPQPVLLVIDQFEQLLQQDGFSLADMATLTALLKELLKYQGIILIVSLRNDFYANAMEIDGFAALKEEGHQYDMPAPTVADIARMIRLPALAAGLSFEEDATTGQTLDEVLLQAAAGHADVLPLLEFTLDLLYQRRSKDNQLLFSTYQSLGALEGSIARQAENTYLALPEQTQACWDSVMHQLVTINNRTSVLLAVQQVPLSQFADPQERFFIQSFVDARLFMMAASDSGLSQDRCVSVAHEALLKQWQRVKDWAQRNREAMLKRTQLAADCDRWQLEGRPADMLLPAGKKVREALWIAQLPHLNLSEAEQSFIRLSSHRQTRARRFKVAAITALAMLSVSATGLALYARNQSQIAVSESRQANLLRYKAEELLSFMLGDLRTQLEPIGKLEILEGVGQKTLEYYAGLESRNPLSEASSLKLMAEISISRGDNANGQQQLERALALLSQQHKDSSKLDEQQLLRGNLYYWLGLIAYQQGDYQKVLQHWQQYLAAAEWLVAYAPDNKQWKIEASSARHNLGALALKLEDYPLAREHFGGSLEIERQILAMDPKNAEAKRALRGTMLWQSDVEFNLLELAAARALAESAVELTLSYIVDAPDNFGFQFELLSAYNVLINYQLLSGDGEGLHQSFTQALPIAKALSARDIENASWNIKVATLLTHYFDYLLLYANAQTDFASQANELTLRTYAKLQHVPSQQRLYTAMLMARRKNNPTVQLSLPPPSPGYHIESSPKLIVEWKLSCEQKLCTDPVPELTQPLNGRSINSLFARGYAAILKQQFADVEQVLAVLKRSGIHNAHLQDLLEHK